MAKGTRPIPKHQRLVSLALFLSDRSFPASKTDIARNVEGYAALLNQDAASEKMLDRDLVSLKELGLHAKRTPSGDYCIEQAQQAAPLAVSSEEALRLRLMCLAPLCDPSFVYDEELRSALTKLSSRFDKGSPLFAATEKLPPSPTVKKLDEEQRELVKTLKSCCELRKSIRFCYVNAKGEESVRVVEPHGLIDVEQDWYLLGFDRGTKELREFRLSRMQKVKHYNTSETPDFEAVDFNSWEHLHFPFSFGTLQAFTVVFLIPSPAKTSLCERWANAGIYRIEGDDEHLLMVAQARSVTQAARWAVEYSPQALPLYPQELRDSFFEGLLVHEELL